MSRGELVRLIKLDRVPAGPVTVEANEAERVALAQRFNLEAIHELVATVELAQDGPQIDARGHLHASLEQHCALSDQPFATKIDEPLTIRFVPALAIPAEDEEIEFDADAPDEVEYAGAAFDLGEAVAQSLGLAIDPYAVGPDAETARREAGILDEDAPSGPFAALAALNRTKP